MLSALGSAALSLAVPPAADASGADAFVTLTDGRRLRGRDRDGMKSFLGLPFAMAPLGALRFRPPQPIPPPRKPGETVDATQYRPNCNQPLTDPPCVTSHPWRPPEMNPEPTPVPVSHNMSSLRSDAWLIGLPLVPDSIPDWPGLNATFSEDCLYLNVYAPSRPLATTGLPVLFYLFGGGDLDGGAHDTQLDARHALSATRDALVVVPNWRLGAFGWLGSWQVT